MRIHYNKITCELKCSWIDCAYGMGLAGAGRCPGAWFMVNCPEYETIPELEERWAKEQVNMEYETCEICGDPTGKSGEGEDSLFAEWNVTFTYRLGRIVVGEKAGPFCVGCYDCLSIVGLI